MQVYGYKIDLCLICQNSQRDHQKDEEQSIKASLDFEKMKGNIFLKYTQGMEQKILWALLDLMV